MMKQKLFFLVSLFGLFSFELNAEEALPTDSNAVLKKPSFSLTSTETAAFLPAATSTPLIPPTVPDADKTSDNKEKTNSPFDENGIRNLVQSFAIQWNKRNPSALAELWEENGDFIYSNGRLAVNPNEVDIILYSELRGPYAQSKMELNVQNIRFFSPLLAFIDVDAFISGITGVTGTEGREKSSQNLHYIFIVSRVSESSPWKIVVARAFLFTGPVTKVNP